MFEFFGWVDRTGTDDTCLPPSSISNPTVEADTEEATDNDVDREIPTALSSSASAMFRERQNRGRVVPMANNDNDNDDDLEEPETVTSTRTASVQGSENVMQQHDQVFSFRSLCRWSSPRAGLCWGDSTTTTTTRDEPTRFGWIPGSSWYSLCCSGGNNAGRKWKGFSVYTVLHLSLFFCIMATVLSASLLYISQQHVGSDSPYLIRHVAGWWNGNAALYDEIDKTSTLVAGWDSAMGQDLLWLQLRRHFVHILTEQPDNATETTSPQVLTNGTTMIDNERDLTITSIMSSSLERPESPAYKALEWIMQDLFVTSTEASRKNGGAEPVNDTTVLLTLVDTLFQDRVRLERLEQRFALACLFFSWAGPSWFSLTGSPSSSTQDTSSSTMSLADGWNILSEDQFQSGKEREILSEECRWRGVECNENGQVIGLHLTSALADDGKNNNNTSSTFPTNITTNTNIAGNGNLNHRRLLTHRSNAEMTATTSETANQQGSVTTFPPRFVVGTIPRELGLLSQLRYLDISNQQLRGSIPRFLYQRLTSLETLDLSINRLTGTIHEDIGKWVGLQKLVLSENLFEGTIPIEGLKKLKALEYLKFYKNEALSGNVWDLLQYWPALSHIDVVSTRLSGTLPDNLCRAVPNLRAIGASLSAFHGTIPNSIEDCQQLTDIGMEQSVMDGGGLSGTIPSTLGQLPKLAMVFLGSNSFTGTIPPELGLLSNSLVMLDLKGNAGLTGTIPSELANLSPHLQRLSVSNCAQLTGTIPEELGSALQQLRDAEFSGTRLHGTVPDGFCANPNLIVLTADCSSAVTGGMECHCCDQCSI